MGFDSKVFDEFQLDHDTELTIYFEEYADAKIFIEKLIDEIINSLRGDDSHMELHIWMKILKMI